MPFVKTSQAEIFYEQSGSGPDVVWVAGGGSMGQDWRHFQTPYFDTQFRNTTFDNRGIGQTKCDVPMPWEMSTYSDDLAELITAVCKTPVIMIGVSLGAAIVQQVAIDHRELLKCAVVMGTGAWSPGWGWDYQHAEIEFRRAGGRLDGMMGVCHYASMLYPARALGDRELWPKIRDILVEWMDSGENEESLIPQWETSLRYDQREDLRGVTTPMHVIAFEEDIQAPPQEGEELASIVPGAELHLLAGMGHGSWLGHAHDRLNPYIKKIFLRYV